MLRQMLLSRDQLCAFLEMDVEEFKSKHRRGQVPSSIRRDDDSVRGFTVREVLVAITAKEFVTRHEMSWGAASRIASTAFIVGHRWKDIIEGVDAISLRKNPKKDILFASVDFIRWDGRSGAQVGSKQNYTEVGTLAEIAERHPNASRVVAISMPQVVRQMQIMARQLKIDLSAFWEKWA